MPKHSREPKGVDKHQRHIGKGHHAGGTQTPTVQNKGSTIHKAPHDPHKAGHAGSGLSPRAGTEAVAFHGTMVHAAGHEGITRPSSHNAGSHDHLAREHADHVMMEHGDAMGGHPGVPHHPHDARKRSHG